MAVQVLTVQDSAPNVAVVYVPAGVDGDAFANDGQVIVLYQIPTPRNLTVEVPLADLPDETELRNGPDGDFGRLDPLKYNDPVTGLVKFTWDDPNGVLVAAVRYPVKGFTGNQLAGSLC